MSDSMEQPPKYFNSSLLSGKCPFSDNIYEGEGIVKYRNIPVTQTYDTWKISDALCENACGVKEVKNIESMAGSYYYANRNTIFDAKSVNGFPKQLPKLDTALGLKSIQRKLYSDHDSIERMGKVSLSEPNLTMAKDRGDSVPFQDMYNDGNFPTSCVGDGKKLQSEDRNLKACIYFKKGEKVYKSKVEAVNFQVDDANDIFGGDIKKQKYRKNESSGRTVSNRRVNKCSTGLGTNNLKFDNENDDFEIAILLSGFKNISVGSQKKKTGTKAKQTEADKRQGENGKREHHIQRIMGKKFEMMRKSYRTPLRMLEVKQPTNGSCSGLTYTVKSPANLDFSSKESDSEYEYYENQNVVVRRRKGTQILGTAKDGMKTGGSGTYRSTTGGTEMSKSKVLSHSSVSSDMYKIPKLKISDEILWEKFEIIFRNYATTTRHSGEVIPRKISTLWMMNTGVVGELLTAYQADSFFRMAAGAKITMNAQEYKGFLIKLSLRMKLPYYEIYRRMCGM